MAELKELLEQFRTHERNDREDFGSLTQRMANVEHQNATMNARLSMLMGILGALGVLIGGPVVAFVVRHW